MTIEKAFENAKKEIIGDNLIITSVDEGENLHKKFIALRRKLSILGLNIMDVMPHYRGEQNISWDIQSGIFRPPFNIADPIVGKQLEKKAIYEFEKVIVEKVGAATFRNIFNEEKHGKAWDLLMQAQHAGIRTILTDWSPEMVSALYFATELSDESDIENTDGQIWCLITPTQWIFGQNSHKSIFDLDPYNILQTVVINPSTLINGVQNRIFEYRMYKQKGRFIMPSNSTCHIPLNKQKELIPFIIKAKIPAEYKQKIRDELAKRNVIRSTMYIDENSKMQDFISEINNSIFNITHKT